MSKHSEIPDNTLGKKYLEDLCTERWGKIKSPCKGCKYRYPIKDDMQCCLFPSIPKDWAFLEGRSQR